MSTTLYFDVTPPKNGAVDKLHFGRVSGARMLVFINEKSRCIIFRSTGEKCLTHKKYSPVSNYRLYALSRDARAVITATSYIAIYCLHNKASSTPINPVASQVDNENINTLKYSNSKQRLYTS